MIKQKQIVGLVPVESALPVAFNQVALDFSINRFYTEYQLTTSITFTQANNGNVPGNRITCIITGDGENTITLPAGCKIVRGSFNSGNGTKNLIEMQYFSSIVITKIYQIP